jgi:hypothetical protein
MRTLLYLFDHWYIPVAVGIAILLWIITRGRALPPTSVFKTELEAIKAAAKARDYEAMLGTQDAIEAVKKDHLQEILKLNEAQAQKAKELNNDPVALSRFLVRAASVNASNT